MPERSALLSIGEKFGKRCGSVGCLRYREIARYPHLALTGCKSQSASPAAVRPGRSQQPTGAASYRPSRAIANLIFSLASPTQPGGQCPKDRISCRAPVSARARTCRPFHRSSACFREEAPRTRRSRAFWQGVRRQGEGCNDHRGDDKSTDRLLSTDHVSLLIDDAFLTRGRCEHRATHRTSRARKPRKSGIFSTHGKRLCRRRCGAAKNG